MLSLAQHSFLPGDKASPCPRAVLLQWDGSWILIKMLSCHINVCIHCCLLFTRSPFYGVQLSNDPFDMNEIHVKYSQIHIPNSGLLFGWRLPFKIYGVIVLIGEQYCNTYHLILADTLPSGTCRSQTKPCLAVLHGVKCQSDYFLILRKVCSVEFFGCILSLSWCSVCSFIAL